MTRVRMATDDEFKDWDTLSKYLGEQLSRNRVALVLGAGVSKPFNLPDWKELLNMLYAEKNEKIPVLDLKRQAEHFRNKFHSRDKSAFMVAVRTALYERVDASYEVLRRCDTLAALASLAMNSRRGSAAQIITFNWDDLLETYLEYHGFVTASITSDRHWSTSADVTTFHPHGFLPFSPARKLSDDIVFDQWSYTGIMGTEGRLWRESLGAVMRTRTCLFVGLSGNDDNLDLLLRECKEFHASIQDSTAYWGIVFTTSSEDADLTFWQRRGVYPVTVVDFYTDLPKKLFQIAQSAAKALSS